MKKLIITVLVSAFVFGIVGMAQANYIEDFNTLSAAKYKLNNNQTATINFDLSALNNVALINSNSAKPAVDVNSFQATEVISSALLNLTFFTNANTGTGNLNITFKDGSFSYQLYNGSITNFSTDIKTIDPLKSYIADGKFTTEITVSGMAKNGSAPYLTITDSKLDVAAQPVPIPGAAWLLGAGLIGLVGARRKQLA